MEALQLVAVAVVFAALAFLFFRMASNPTKRRWESRVDEAETWDQLAGPASEALPVSPTVSTWTVGGKIRRWIPPVQDGLITIIADEQQLLLVTRKSHPAQRRTFTREDESVSLACRPDRLGGLVLIENGSGAKLVGWEVDKAIDGLRSLGWTISSGESA
jgi:hypothetical protein